MSNDFDASIEVKENELKSLKSQMEEVRKQFVHDSTAFISKWYLEQAESYVKGSADITLSLGKDKIKQMKDKVKELQDNTGNITNEFLSDPELWWHLKENKDLSYDYHENAAPRGLDDAIRLALGKLGTILEEFGYDAKTKSTCGTDSDVWVEYDSTDRYHPPNGRPYFPHNMEWSNEMKNTIQKYSEMVNQVKNIRFKIFTLDLEKKKNEAGNLWDSV